MRKPSAHGGEASGEAPGIGVISGGGGRVDVVLRKLEIAHTLPQLTGWSDRPPAEGDPFQQVDLVVAAPGMPVKPGPLFDRLRFGGQFVCVGTRESDLATLAKAFASTHATGFALEQAPVSLPLGGAPKWKFWRRDKAWYFTARKTHIVRPNEYSNRFTYDVSLHPKADEPDGYVVRKVIPSHERVLRNLQHKFPQVPLAELERRTSKLCDEVFPVFLTREARFLGMLQEKLSPEYRKRVPRLVDLKKGDRQLVTQLDMAWLRMGNEVISQIEFARQTADLLRAVHEQTQLMHLDLRLDNVLVTRDGVALVDFGSAAREGEDLGRNPLLRSLFDEIMQTSQIQRVLSHMAETGHVTSQTLLAIRGQADKKLDTFYLAVQMAKPTSSPDVAQLVDYDPGSMQSRLISELTARVLRPAAGDSVESASDLLKELQAIERRLHRLSSREPAMAV